MVDDSKHSQREAGRHRRNRRSRWRLRRALRIGDKGSAVRDLQESLVRLGLYPGRPDGVFGYLTQDAVEKLQGEFGLRVDGVAGPMVNRVLHHPGPRLLRHCATVDESDSQETIAAKLEVPKKIVAAVWPKAGVVPGTNFCLHKNLVIGSLPQGHTPRHSSGFPAESRELTALAYSWWPMAPGRKLPESRPEGAADMAQSCHALFLPVVGIPSIGQSGAVSEEVLASLGDKRYLRLLKDALAAECKQETTMGVLLRLGSLPGAAIPAVTRLLRDAAACAQSCGKLLVVAAPRWDTPGKGAWGLSWRRLGEIAHYVLLEPSDPTEPKSLLPLEQLEHNLQQWTKVLPPWQLLHAIPVGGLLGKGERVSYDTVRTLAYRQKASVQWDPTEYSPRFSYREEGELFEAWFENSESVRRKLDVIQARKLAGICLSPLGYEDSRMWDVIKQRVAIHHFR